MKLSDKLVRIAAEVDEIKSIYRRSQLLNVLITVNAIGWLVAGLILWVVASVWLAVPSLGIGLMNIFIIWYSRGAKNVE